MKIFEYEYFIRWGRGQGIIIAETKELAIKMLTKKKGNVEDLEITEKDISIPQIIDHSWEE